MASEETDAKFEILKDGESKMKNTLDVLQKNLGSIRAGRAVVDMLDPITVKVNERKFCLKQMATIQAPQPDLLTLTVWDIANVDYIVKALQECSYHFNPNVDGPLVRVPIPPLSLERRQELSKLAKKYTDECKVSLRNIRKHCSDDLKALQREKKISEEQAKAFMTKQVQKVLDRMNQEAEKRLEKKTKDILTI